LPTEFIVATYGMPLLFSPAYRVTRRDLRLGSGLVLFAYITAHLANHALGLVSVNVAEAGLRVAVAFWHSLPGTVLLYSAAAIHLALALVAVYERRTLRMPAPEALRIALEFGIPALPPKPTIESIAECRKILHWHHQR
jgi:adenylate cyclase